MFYIPFCFIVKNYILTTNAKLNIPVPVTRLPRVKKNPQKIFLFSSKKITVRKISKKSQFIITRLYYINNIFKTLE